MRFSGGDDERLRAFNDRDGLDQVTVLIDGKNVTSGVVSIEHLDFNFVGTKDCGNDADSMIVYFCRKVVAIFPSVVLDEVAIFALIHC